MSYNLVDPTTGDLTRVAGGIDTSIIPSNASASNKLVTTSNMAYLLKDKMSCYTWDTNKTLRAVFYEVSDRDIMPDVNDIVGKRVIARYGNVLINRITQLNGIKNFYWDNTLVLSCPYNDDVTKLTDVLEIFAGTTSWQQLATTDSTLKTIQLSGSVDCNTLTEPGLYTASSNAVISITNTPPDIGSAVQLDGGFSVLVTKTNVDGVYYGMQMFIPYGSDVPFIRKSYYLNGQYWTAWGEIATMDKVVPCIENKNPNAKTVTFELNSNSWNCGTIYGNTNNGGNFKYDYYVTSNHIELVKQDGYGQQGSITASLSGTTLTLTADGNTTIKTVTIIKS